MNQNTIPGITQGFGQQSCPTLCVVTLMNHVDITLGSIGVGIRLLPQVEQALHAYRETYSRCWFAAQQFHQAVIPPTATNGALSTKTVGHPLENGQVVVVQPANEPRVQGVFNTGILQTCANAFKVCQ